MFAALRRTETHPTAVIVHRDHTVSGGAPHKGNYYGPQDSYGPPNQDAETAPRPVDYSSFSGVGKLLQPTRLTHFLAMPDWLSVRAWEGAGGVLVQRVPGALVVGMPATAGQRPMRETVNIEGPASVPYSSLATINPATAVPIGSVYRKLT